MSAFLFLAPLNQLFLSTNREEFKTICYATRTGFWSSWKEYNSRSIYSSWYHETHRILSSSFSYPFRLLGGFILLLEEIGWGVFSANERHPLVWIQDAWESQFLRSFISPLTVQIPTYAPWPNSAIIQSLLSYIHFSKSSLFQPVPGDMAPFYQVISSL